MALARRSVDLNPLSPAAQMSLALTAKHAGRLEEALAALEKVSQMQPDFPDTRTAGSCTCCNPVPQLALTEAQSEVDDMSRLCGLALAYDALGRKTESVLAELIQKYHGDAAYYTACVYATRGEADPAMQRLERAHAEQAPAMRDVKTEPLNNVKRDPRYRALLRKLNLPQ